MALVTKRTEEIAAEIDAILHGGQRAPDRYRKFEHLIEQYGQEVKEAARQVADKYDISAEMEISRMPLP